jgi:hypothetical protein
MPICGGLQLISRTVPDGVFFPPTVTLRQPAIKQTSSRADAHRIEKILSKMFPGRAAYQGV